MLQKEVYFKSDFKIMLASETGWGGLPFRLQFYTNVPTRAFVACYDGHEYHNCHLQEDGRLCVAFDNHNLGIGTLILAPTFYLNDDCYKTGVCDEYIPPFAVVLKNDPTPEDPEPEEYNLVLSLRGAKTLETIGTLPAFYQKGDKGDPGLTPEEHDALVQATADANAAADRANGVIDDAEAAARLATAAAVNADNKAAAAAEAARLADAARQQLTTTFNEKVAELEADYAQKKAALDADYAGVKQSLSADYAAKKAALDADYASAKSALSTAYAEAINGINQRMSAIETQYATDKVEWQRQVDAILAKFEQDFATAEAAREERVALAIAHADTAAGNANAAATQAGNVNAVLDGDNLTVTDRNGQSVTRNVRGPQGEPGASVTFFPAVTIFGQPHIDGPQISGFSANDYLQFPFVVNFAGRPWKLHFDIATGADVSKQHNIFDSQFGLAFAFANGHFVMAMSSNGTSWDLGANEGTHAILPNQTYHIRMSWDGSVYKLEFSTDEVTWTTDITVSSTASLYPRQIVIGKDIFTGEHFYNGSINFADARLTIAGVIVWEGMEEIGAATRMAIDMSNIDDAGKARVNEVSMEGEVGQKLNDLSAEVDDIVGSSKVLSNSHHSAMSYPYNFVKGKKYSVIIKDSNTTPWLGLRKTPDGSSSQGWQAQDNVPHVVVANDNYSYLRVGLFGTTGSIEVSLVGKIDEINDEIDSLKTRNIISKLAYSESERITITDELDGFAFNPTEEHSIFCADFFDRLIAKFDELCSKHSAITKYDSVAFVNDSLQSPLVYPAYTKLNGQASGMYLPTPSYTIPIYKIGMPTSSTMNEKRVNIVLIAGQHGWEISSPFNSYVFARHLLEASTGNYAKLLQSANIYILPLLNVYGCYHGYYVNANGVNINRNYPYDGWTPTEGAVPFDSQYAGIEAGSEFETQLAMAVLNKVKPQIALDMHGNGADNYYVYLSNPSYGQGFSANDLLADFTLLCKRDYPQFFGTEYKPLWNSSALSVSTSLNGGRYLDTWIWKNICQIGGTFEVNLSIYHKNGVRDVDTYRSEFMGLNAITLNEWQLRNFISKLWNLLPQ